MMDRRRSYPPHSPNRGRVISAKKNDVEKLKERLWELRQNFNILRNTRDENIDPAEYEKVVKELIFQLGEFHKDVLNWQPSENISERLQEELAKIPLDKVIILYESEKTALAESLQELDDKLQDQLISSKKLANDYDRTRLKQHMIDAVMLSIQEYITSTRILYMGRLEEISTLKDKLANFTNTVHGRPPRRLSQELRLHRGTGPDENIDNSDQQRSLNDARREGTFDAAGSPARRSGTYDAGAPARRSGTFDAGSPGRRSGTFDRPASPTRQQEEPARHPSPWRRGTYARAPSASPAQEDDPYMTAIEGRRSSEGHRNRSQSQADRRGSRGSR